jgi:ribosomal protein S18 acetylase RimI-like enzyme
MAATIRAARLADLGRVLVIEQSAFGATAWPWTVFRQHLDLCGELFAVAEASSGVVGYTLAARSAAPDEAWILGAAVEEASRNQGVGRALLTHVIARAGAVGVARLRCTVRPGNAPVEHVMAAVGFTDLAYDPDYFGPGEGRRILELA